MTAKTVAPLIPIPGVMASERIGGFVIDERHEWLKIKKSCGPLSTEEKDELLAFETKLKELLQ